MKSVNFFVLFLLLFVSNNVFSQNELITSSGSSVFNIDVPSAIVIDPNITVTTTSDIDNAIVIISEGYVQGQDELVYPSSLYGVTGSFDASTGILALNGTATDAEYQEILRSIEFNTTTPLQTNDRIITFSLGDALPFYPCGATEPHFYKLITENEDDWFNARDAAAAQTYFGFEGYLATIICAEENAFITDKLDASAFIGASDNPSVTGSTQHNWFWVTGPEAGLQFTADYQQPITGVYSNWNTGEPNNSDGQEDFACIYGLSHPSYGQTGYWNDIRQNPWEGDINNPGGDLIAGYVLEFGGMPGDPPLNIADNKTIVFQNGYPTLDLTVTGSTVCEGENGTVIIQASELNVVYEAFLNTTSVGTATGTGGNIQITIPSANLSVGDNVVQFTADNGVNSGDLTNTATVTVIANPLTDKIVTGNRMCGLGNGVVTILNSENGVDYEAFIGVNSVGSASGNGSDITITVSESNLQLGENIVDVFASNGNCDVQLSDTASIFIKSLPLNDRLVSGNEMCGLGDGLVTIQNSESGIIYEAFIGANSVGTVTGNGSDVSINVAQTELQEGNNTIVFYAYNGNCEIQLTNSAIITVNSNPLDDKIVDGCQICSSEDGQIVILNSEDGVLYEAFINSTSVGTANGNGSDVSINISQTDLFDGENVIEVFAANGNCQVQLTDTANVELFLFDITTLNTEGSTITYGQDGTITLLETENGVTYNFYKITSDSTLFSGYVIGDGGEMIYEVGASSLETGDNNFQIFAQYGKCTELVGDDVIIVEAEVEIPDGFSPNGNGINDYYVIEGIDAFPTNNVKIFNRWGTLVFEMPNYNNDINAWDGRPNKGLGAGNDFLPEGTYFYVVDLMNGMPPIKGTVYLKR